MKFIRNTLQVSTPIFYVNGAPHLGHLHSVTLADAIYRAQKLLQPDRTTIFSTGTDEHGLKIQQAAERASQNPQMFCNTISTKFKDLFNLSGIGYTDYIRTTEDRHKIAVTNFWKRLVDNGFIYKDTYKGWYCTADETFLSNSQIIEIKNGNQVNKVSAESKQPVEWMEEENYMFSLSRFQDDLLHWLRDDCVKPQKFATMLRTWIKERLPDLSVSRQRSRLQWGIPVPGDDSQTIYVWVDALVNYLTVSGFPKMETKVDLYHVIGKDILKFHGIYWPALLMAAGLPPPKTILCHSHWTVDHEKMSKSKGNVVEPLKLISKYGVDGTRYFLLREAVPHSDANFDENKMVRILNSELANTLGNLLSRCTARNINKEQVLPKLTLEHFEEHCGQEGFDIAKQAKQLCDEFPKLVLEGNVYRGLEQLMECLRKTNTFVQLKEPWTLAKSPSNAVMLRNVLYVALESLRVCSILLQPVVPNISNGILTKLSLSLDERGWQSVNAFAALDGQPASHEGRPLSLGTTVVFPRIKN